MKTVSEPLDAGREGADGCRAPDDASILSIVRAAEIPLVTGGGRLLRVIAGNVNGAKGPMALSGGAVFAQAKLDPGAVIALHFEADLELAVYVLQGEVKIGERFLTTGQLGVLDAGQRAKVLATSSDDVHFALLGGLPVQGEVLFSGPFVMDTPARLEQARSDYSTGRMGRLEGVPF